MAATWWTSIKRFITRIMLFGVVSLWVYLRMSDINKSSTEFKEKMTRNVMWFGYYTNDIKDFLEDPSLVVFIAVILEAIFNLLAVFGNYFSSLMSTILFGLVTFIYFNPLLPENRISLYETRIELLLNIGSLLSLMLCTFYPYHEEDTKKEVNDMEDIPMDDLKIQDTQNADRKSKKSRK
jgi:hypothetical protein